MQRAVFLMFLGTLVCLLNSCAQPPIRHDCPPESLIVNETILPEGSVADFPISPLPDGGSTSIGIVLGNGEVTVSHYLYPYKIPKGAEKEYESELNRPDDQDMLPYDLSNLQIRADQHALLCSQPEPSPRCKYIARYDNYYILLFLRTSSLDTPVDVLIPAIQDIDNRMVKCLEEYPVQ